MASAQSSAEFTAAVVLAEFDIDRGSTVRCCVPEGTIEPSSDNLAAFAELMLPEGSHHRKHDWTYAITQPSGTGSCRLVPEDTASSAASSRLKEPTADADTLMHVFSIVQSRKDASRKRGSNVKAVALAAPFQWLSALRPALEILLDELYTADAAYDSKAADGTTWKDVASTVCGRFQASVAGFLELLASDASPKRLHHDWLQRSAMRAARVHPGLSHGASSAGRAAEEAARARPRWAFATQSLLLDGFSSPAPRKEESSSPGSASAVVPDDGAPCSVPVLLDRTLEPDCTPAASVASLVGVFGGAAPAILTAAMAGRRVLFVGGKGVSAGDVASLVLATACTIERALPGTLGRAVPSASLTDLSFLERAGGYIAGVSNPLFRDRSAWWDVLCEVEPGTITVKDEVALPEHGSGTLRALARQLLRLAAIEAATEAKTPGEPMAAESAEEQEAEAAGQGADGLLPAGAEPAPESAQLGAARSSSEEAEGTEADPLDAHLPHGSWRGTEVAAASKLRSGARFGEAWLQEAASASCEALCSVLDGALAVTKRTCGSWVKAAAQGSATSEGVCEPGEAPEDQVLSCAMALPALAALNSPRLALIAASQAYLSRRRQARDRRASEVEAFPSSSFARAFVSLPADSAHVPSGSPPPTGRAIAVAADASPSGSGALAALCSRLDSPAALRRLGRAASRALRLLRRCVSGGGAPPTPERLVPTASLRRALATLLVACSRSQRDVVRLSAALPESSGGLLPAAMPLLHKSVPVRAFAAALLERIEASPEAYVSARTGSLNASLLSALERSRPLVPVALESRELEAVVAELASDPGHTPDGSVGRAGAADLAPFNPTSVAGIEAAVALLRLRPEDTLLDVGCGDARVLVEACLRTGCSGVGVEADQELVDRALARREEHGLTERLRVVCGDATQMDLSALGATALFVYLVPEGLRIVWPALQPLVDAGMPAASYVFRAPGATVVDQKRLGPVSVYLYGSRGKATTE